jgi:antitoxin component YwqK of YwqJK toxin-antitoxin module
MKTRSYSHNSLLLIIVLATNPGFIMTGQEQAKIEGATHTKEIRRDKNSDGIVDLVEYYDSQGALVKTLMDSSGDGKFNELVIYRSGKPVRAEKDLNGDGTADKFFQFNEYGKLSKTATDTDGDGKIDHWGHYQNGIRRKVERDTNGNGKADLFMTYDEKGTLIKTESNDDGDANGEMWQYEDGDAVLYFHNGQLY